MMSRLNVHSLSLLAVVFITLKSSSFLRLFATKLVNIMPKRRAILWDVDGTLSDSYKLGYSSTNSVLKPLGIEINEESYHQGTKLTTPRRLAWHVTGDPDHPSGIDLGDQFDKLYVELVSTSTAPFYPGILNVLNTLENKYDGIIFGALSNACGAYVRAVLSANGVTDRFRVALGADEVPAAKPDPDGLLLICNTLSLSPDECIYIGDSPSDGQAATAAGMVSVGVTWGSHPASSVIPAFTITVNDTEDLCKVLDELVNSTDG